MNQLGAGPPHDARASYQTRRDRFAAVSAEALRSSSRIGRLRLVIFVAAAATVVAANGASGPTRTAWLGATGLLLVAFALFAARHGEVKRRIRRFRTLAELNTLGLARLDRGWDAIPGSSAAGLEDHPYAMDLDLYGHASVRALLGVVSPAPGEPTLRSWLLAPAPLAELQRRQAAVRELAPLADLRDDLAANVRLAGMGGREDLERFLRWIDGEPWLLRRPALLWFARALTVVTIGLLAWWLPDPSRPAYWGIALTANLATLATLGRRARRTFAEASLGADVLGGYAASFELVANGSFQSPLLREIAESLGGQAGADGAATAVRKLGRLVQFTELRFSPMMHFAANAVALVDVHELAAVERWRERARARARQWFVALGEAEALSALATLAYDQPDWAFPDLVAEGPTKLEAQALGHPLLSNEARVTNDVTIGPPGTFLFVTGSNMSGKSTLLRAIGANVVLAQAGGPVCASRMRLGLVDLRTSMRVSDSLEHGVSLFMAELQRLRKVVDAAREARRRGGTPVLYLLDEVLHGTNTAERQIAARRIIMHLLDEGAIGAVSTHDLGLVDTRELSKAAQAVHFTEHFEPGPPPRMTFDYTLRPGVATSRNALRLVEMMGLG